MVKLFMLGEPLYMGIITILLLVMILIYAYPFHRVSFEISNIKSTEKRLRLIKSIGLFSLILGIFVQFLGLYGALEVIEVWGKVESETLFQGIRISSIPMFYGLAIFALSRAISSRKFQKRKLHS